jgi:endonuclease-3
MSVKSLGFGEINNRAIKLRQIATGYPVQQSFVVQSAADKFLESNPLAPIIAVICDQQITAEDAWEFPFWLYNQLGGGPFTASNIYKLGESVLKHYLQTYLGDKWPSGMSADDQGKYLNNISSYIVNACRLIANQLADNPDNMFKLGNYNIPQVYFILRSLPGVGAKKASMIARDFAMSAGSWFLGLSRRLKQDLGIVFKVNEKHFSEVPVDIQVVTVFGRVMGEFRKTPQRSTFPNYSPDIQNLAKLAFPQFPSKLDEILWAVGREYCDERNPICDACPLNNLPCEYTLKR